MAEFKAFTIGASVGVVVLGAAAGAALGALSSGPPALAGHSPTPRATPTARSTARPMAHTGAAMGSAAVDRASGGKPPGSGTLTGPGVQHLTSMPTGTVRVWRDMQGMLQVQLDLYGLTPGSAHNLSIDGPHSTAADPEVRFPSFGADSTGRANATLTAASAVAALQGGSRVSIRLGTFSPGTGPGQPAEELIAQSAVLPAQPRGQQRNVIPRSYGPTGAYQGRLHGSAKIAYDQAARTLSVTVTAFGLPPGAHAAHIHLGTCQAQGGVKYMLPDFQADASGNIVAQTRTVTGVTSAPPHGGWYLNLHQGDSQTILASGKPTLNFRPELCANIASVQTAGP
jgi:hypothetical protein